MDSFFGLFLESDLAYLQLLQCSCLLLCAPVINIFTGIISSIFSIDCKAVQNEVFSEIFRWTQSNGFLIQPIYSPEIYWQTSLLQCVEIFSRGAFSIWSNLQYNLVRALVFISTYAQWRHE